MTSGTSGTERLGDVGEDGLIASVVSRYGPLPDYVIVGPGDDAAVLEVPGAVVLSTDTLVEGRDFRRDWSSARDVGIKTAAQNLADIAAMGARPLALVVSLAAAPDLPLEWAAGLAEGLDEECRRAGAAVVGGDVSEAAEVVVTGTALGVLASGAAAVRRSGARPGDVVAIAGRTGPSAAGLALLLAGWADGPGTEGGAAEVLAEFVRAHRRPQPPYAAGPEAAASGATAMIDTSDGLLRDASRLAEASGAILDLDPDLLVPDGDLRAAAADLGDPGLAREWVLTGGEDHAMLACFPAGADLPAGFRRIGRVLSPPAGPAAPDVVRVQVGGRPWQGPTGWHHFCS